jgi:hypothetical protein
MQIERKGMIVYIPKGYWTSTFIRSSNYGSNDNKRTTKRKSRTSRDA